MAIVQLQTCTLTQQWVSHSHDHHQLILATSGNTELSIEGRGNRITGDTGCLIPSGYHHDYLGDGRNTTLVMDLPVAALGKLTRSDDAQRLFERPTFYSVPGALKQMGATLAQQARVTPGLHDEISALILRTLYLGLYDRALPAERRPAVAAPSVHSRLSSASMNQLVAYVEAHLASDIKVEDLAALCCLSPGYFHQAFRAQTGQTPMAFVQQRRLQRARWLLSETDWPIGTIAAEVGFRDQGSFSRACRRRFGCAPSSLRT
ncbi:AraC family transcriptional regulator [Saccharospirillum sp. HFRX-1]|uniref:AraC family transcriptional regulator n=1 Tax=unclassified Saccharospirillum TaxID=2633430 RepID=UPI0037159152